MPQITFYRQENIPVETHRVKIVRELTLLPVRERLEKMRQTGYNTFALRNEDIFLDMLTDSGVNAMSDRMQSAMLRADDAYAGSATFYRMRDKLREIFGMPYLIPAHQGRACENLLANRFVKAGSCAIMNYFFTSVRTHVQRLGGHVETLLGKEGMIPRSNCPFKGNIDLAAMETVIRREGAENIAFLRIESGTNLIGGQPVSFANMKAAADLARRNGIVTVLDASLLQDNLYFIKTREVGMKEKSIREITRMIADLFDVIYFSGRKFGFGRGGGILVRDESLFRSLEALVPVYEGHMSYGGMSVAEMEAMTVGFDESMEMDVISQGPRFIDYTVRALDGYGVPVITPGGGLGAHLNAGDFLSHLPWQEYPSAALACALYICGGIRGMECGTLSQPRGDDGQEHPAPMELVRLAMPRRVFTLSQVEYVIDRVKWLYDHRDLIGGFRLVQENLRDFNGVLEPLSDWPEKLAAAYAVDFPGDQ